MTELIEKIKNIFDDVKHTAILEFYQTEVVSINDQGETILNFVCPTLTLKKELGNQINNAFNDDFDFDWEPLRSENRFFKELINASNENDSFSDFFYIDSMDLRFFNDHESYKGDYQSLLDKVRSMGIITFRTFKIDSLIRENDLLFKENGNNALIIAKQMTCEYYGINEDLFNFLIKSRNMKKIDNFTDRGFRSTSLCAPDAFNKFKEQIEVIHEYHEKVMKKEA